MEKILAEGTGWELVHEAGPHAPDKTILILYSPFGKVEVVAKGLIILGLFDKIEIEYLRLKEQGPLQKP